MEKAFKNLQSSINWEASNINTTIVGDISIPLSNLNGKQPESFAELLLNQFVPYALVIAIDKHINKIDTEVVESIMRDYQELLSEHQYITKKSEEERNLISTLRILTNTR